MTLITLRRRRRGGVPERAEIGKKFYDATGPKSHLMIRTVPMQSSVQ